MFRDNRLYGKCIIIDNDLIIMAHYSNGELKEVVDKKPLKDR